MFVFTYMHASSCYGYECIIKIGSYSYNTFLHVFFIQLNTYYIYTYLYILYLNVLTWAYFTQPWTVEHCVEVGATCSLCVITSATSRVISIGHTLNYI